MKIFNSLLLISLSSILVIGCSTTEDVAEEEFPIPEEELYVENNLADFTSAWTIDDNVLARPPNIINNVDIQLLQIDEEGLDRLLPQMSQARIKREGSIYWLEVDLPPERVWTLLRDFWVEQGFAIEIEVPELGVLETDWRQDRSKVLGTGITRFLDVAFERIHDTGERYRFRSRIERNPNKEDSTDIFISYRAIEELPGQEFRNLENDPTLEAEMLRRLMLKFRLPEESLASLEDFSDLATITEVYEVDGNTLVVFLNREESWRRVLQGLDRSGYTVVDKNESIGLIKIKIADPTIKKEELGFFAQLFGGQQEDGEPFEVDVVLASSENQETIFEFPDDEVGVQILNVLVTNI